jgi:hypothetical protein
MPYTININNVSRTVDVEGEWPTRRTVGDELEIDHPATTERLPLTKK